MCITWNKDYQGLFDYESKEITRFPLVAKQSGILMKVGNQYEVVTQLTKAMVTEVTKWPCRTPINSCLSS